MGEKDGKKLFGSNYSFSLVDSIYDCEEYLVDLDLLINSFLIENIDFKKRMSFNQFLNSLEARNVNLEKKIYRNLNDNEKDVVDLYDVIIFKKK